MIFIPTWPFFLCFLITVLCEVDFYSHLTFFLWFLAFCNPTPYLHWLNISLPVQVRQVSLYFKDKMLLVLHNLCHCCRSLGSIFSVDATTGADVMRLGLTKPSQREREREKRNWDYIPHVLPYSNVHLFQRKTWLNYYNWLHFKKVAKKPPFQINWDVFWQIITI